MRITDTNNCYSLLRQLDSRSAEGDKYIVLDVSTESALRTILTQVRDNSHGVLVYGGMSVMNAMFIFC